MMANKYTRRDFFRMAGCAAAAVALNGTALAQASAPQGKSPNIVFILADDLGYGDPTCYSGQSKIPTPADGPVRLRGDSLHRCPYALGGLHAHAVRHS